VSIQLNRDWQNLGIFLKSIVAMSYSPKGMENSNKWMADADNTCGEMLTDYQHFYDLFYQRFQTTEQEDIDKALKRLSK
jgi:hypothetical protein